MKSYLHPQRPPARIVSFPALRRRLAALPLRLFNSWVLGLFLGAVLAVAVHFGGALLIPASATPTGGPAPNPPASPPPAAAPIPTPDDLDGDGIPNLWETQFHHDPNHFADAASDFDNDGLAAKQEYDLWVRTGGAAGNPLGQWRVVSTPLDVPALFPADAPGADVFVVDVNTGGTVLFQSMVLDSSNSMTASRAAVQAPDGMPVEITAISDPIVVPFDINDAGTVVGRTHATSDGIAKGFIWSAGIASELLTPAGNSAVAKRINNHGNWVGFELNPDPLTGPMWLPAAAIDGTIHGNDLFGGLAVIEMIGINEYDQVLAAYLDPMHMTCSLAVARQLGSRSWVEAAGFPIVEQDGSIPLHYNDAAINNFGEFAAATATLGHAGVTEAYYFDGDTHPLAGTEIYGLSDTGMVLSGGPLMPDTANLAGLALTADGVRAPLAALCPAGFIPASAAMASNGKIAATNGITLVALDLQQDTDGDGISDDFEAYYYLHPDDPDDAWLDPDGDGISNLGEFHLRLDPGQFNPRGSDGQFIDLRPGIDADGDGIPNIWEWNNGLDFEDPTDAPQDPDRDGFSSLQEYQLNTDPHGAPSYRIREIGPFPTASSVSMDGTMKLGRGRPAAQAILPVDGTLTESFFCYATPEIPSILGSRRAATWSIQRAATQGNFTFHPSHGSTSLTPIALTDTGAALASHSSNPVTLVYWASPTAVPVSLAGATTAFNCRTFSAVSVSLSGTWAAGWRTLHSTGAVAPVVWKMPVATTTYQPVTLPLTAAGTAFTLATNTVLHVNDQGCVTATARLGTANRAVIWLPDPDTQMPVAALLPTLGGTSSTTIGLSNTTPPIVAGAATLANGQQRATVWNHLGQATDLGTLENGNSSAVTQISPAGLISGTSKVVEGSSSSRYKSFIAKSLAPSTVPAHWTLFPQGPSSYSITHTTLTDAGELLGSASAASSQPLIPTLWRLGRAYPLNSALPAASGCILQNILALNSNGTLLVSAWKNGADTRLLLTSDSDADGDGLPDAYENAHQFNPYIKQAPATDTDLDGLADLLEYANGTDPRSQDTDADGMNDAWEFGWGLNPLDPADAAADADSDHVSNLRESQIGTNPIGTFRTQILHTDTTQSYPQPTVFDDAGRVIISRSRSKSGTLPGGLTYYSSGTDYALLDPAAPGTEQPLPVTQYSRQTYTPDWSQYTYESNAPVFSLDAASKAVRARICQSNQYHDGTNHTFDFFYRLVPDARVYSATDPATWLDWELLAYRLGLDPLDYYSTPNLSSPDGNRLLVKDGTTGPNHLLDAAGNPAGSAPPMVDPARAMSYRWSRLNNQGAAVAMTSRSVPATDAQPAYSHYDLQYWNGTAVTAIPTPAAWYAGVKGTWASICGFSDDLHVLLQRNYYTPSSTWVGEYHLLDLASRTFTRVATPGLGYETIPSISTHNARMVGSGQKPFMLTPGGTCVKLAALRIKDSATAPETTLGARYPSLSPLHITSDGRITATTTNPSGQRIILQIIPHNDLNTNGVADDFEQDVIHSLPGIPSTIDLNADYDGDGYSFLQEWQFGSSDADYLASPNAGNGDGDADHDGIPDKEDADPTNKIINWHKGPRPAFFAKKVSDSPHMGLLNMQFIDFSPDGRILYKDTLGAGGGDFFVCSTSQTPRQLNLHIGHPPPLTGRTDMHVDKTEPRGFLGKTIDNMDETVFGVSGYKCDDTKAPVAPVASDYDDSEEVQAAYMQALAAYVQALAAYDLEVALWTRSSAVSWDTDAAGSGTIPMSALVPGSYGSISLHTDKGVLRFLSSGHWQSSARFNEAALPSIRNLNQIDWGYWVAIFPQQSASACSVGDGGVDVAADVVAWGMNTDGSKGETSRGISVWNLTKTGAVFKQLFSNELFAGRNAYHEITVAHPSGNDRRKLLITSPSGLWAGSVPTGLHFSDVKGISDQGWIVSQPGPWGSPPTLWWGGRNYPIASFTTAQNGHEIAILDAHEINSSGSICVTAVELNAQGEPSSDPALYVLLPYEIAADTDTDSSSSAPILAPDDFRKVSLKGRPKGEDSPQGKSEIDLPDESSSVDAFTRYLRHDTSHVYAPVPASELALQVTMSADNHPVAIPTAWALAKSGQSNQQASGRTGYQQRISALSYGVESAIARDSGPFGMGMTTNLGTKAEFTPVFSKVFPAQVAAGKPLMQISHYKVTVPDESGTLFEFTAPQDFSVFIPTESRIPRENVILTTLTRSGTELVLTKKFGTAVHFGWIGSAPSFSDPLRINTSVYRARITSVVDRHGSQLAYTYPSLTALIPSTISAVGRNMAITIRSSAHGLASGHLPFDLIDSVTDPRGCTTTFTYRAHNVCSGFVPVLDTVTKPDKSFVRYGFSDGVRTAVRRQEGFLRPFLQAEFGQPGDAARIAQLKLEDQNRRELQLNDERLDSISIHLNLTSIEDALGNRYTFDYVPDSRTDLVKAKVQVAVANRHKDLLLTDLDPSLAAERDQIIAEIDKTFVTERNARRLGQYTTQNGQTTAVTDPNTLIYEIPSSDGPDMISKVHLPGNLGVVTFTRPTPAPITLPPGAIQVGYGLPLAGPSIRPMDNVTLVTDAEGKQTRYEFCDVFQFTSPSSLFGGRSRSVNPDPNVPAAKRFQKTDGCAYTKLKISDHLTVAGTLGHFPVEYTFSPEAGLALASSKDKNGHTVTLQYTDTIPTTNSRFARVPAYYKKINGFDPANGSPLETAVFTKFNDPNIETRADALLTKTLTTTYKFDPDSRIMTSSVDPRGNETLTLLDSLKRRTDVLNFEGPTPAANQTTAANLRSHTQYTYHSSFRDFVASETVKKYTTSAYADSSWVTDIATTHTPDAQGRVWKTIVDPTGLVLTTTTTYDAAGNKLTTKDPNGNTTTFTYDSVGHLSTVTYPDSTAAGPVRTSFAYDLAGRKIRETDALGRATLWEYDPLGRPVKAARDMNGNQRIDATDLVTSTTYSKVGRPLTVTDPNGNVTKTFYDDLHRPIAVTNALDDSSFLDYSGPNSGSGLLNGPGYQPTRTLDSCGFIAEATYDAFYRPTVTRKEYQLPVNPGADWTTRALGLTIRSETIYDNNGNATETRAYRAEVGPAITSTTAYDALNRPYLTTAALGTAQQHTTRTLFTSTGLAWKTIAFEGHPSLERHTETEFDAAGRARFTWAPSAATGLIKKTSPGSAADPADSAKTENIYDKNGNVTAVIDALGRRTDTSYDSRNRPYQVQAPEEKNYSQAGAPLARATTQTFYDAVGNPWKTISPRDAVTITEYDAANRPWKATSAFGTSFAAVTQNTYDKNGHVLSVTDANGATTRNQYDALNRLTATAVNPVTGNPSATFAPPNSDDIVVANQYDPVGNLLNVADGEAAKTYNSTTKSWNFIESGGHVTAFEYDGLGRKISQTWDAGSDVAQDEKWTYDALVQLTHSDARNVVSTHNYDALLRPTSVTFTGTAVPGVTALNNTSYTYNGPGPLTAVTHPADTSANQILRRVGYTHDRLDRPLTETSAAVTHTYAYDLLGNRVLVKYGNTNRTLVTHHDALNRVKEIIDTTAAIADAAAAIAYSPTTTDTVTGYQYDAAGGTVATTHPNGTRTNNQYDLLGRLKKTLTTLIATAAVLSACDYSFAAAGSTDPSGYDKLGNLRRIEETYANLPARSVVNAYDKTGRLFTETIGLTATAYSYDKAANRIEKRTLLYAAGAWGQTQIETYLYGTPASGFNTNQLVGISQPNVTPVAGNPATFRVRYTYDANGNRATRTENARTDTHTYDALNRLTSLALQTTAAAAKRGTYTYRYDYRTRRVQRDESAAGGTCRTISFSGGQSVMEMTKTIVPITDRTADAEFDSQSNFLEYAQGLDPLSGIIAARFAYPGSIPYTYDQWAAAAITARVTPAQLAAYMATQGSVTTEFIRGNELGGGIGGLLYTVVAGAATHNLYNSRGDVITQTSAAGTATFEAQYEAFGTRRVETGTAVGRQKANTKDEDPTGLLNEGFRYRDLETGSFITRDPMGFVDGPNVYTYVRQNPWTMFDPLGLASEHEKKWQGVAADESRNFMMRIGASFMAAGEALNPFRSDSSIRQGGRDLQVGLAEGREKLKKAPPGIRELGQLTLGVGSAGTSMLSVPAGLGEMGDSIQQQGAVNTAKQLVTGLVDHAVNNPVEFTGELGVGVMTGKAMLGSKSARVTQAEATSRVFWSGSPEAKAGAEAFAKGSGGTTLEMTLAGKVLDKVTTKQTYPLLKPLWDRASTNFAKGAVGSVDVFLSSKGVRLESVWATKEFPVLFEKGNPVNYHATK